MSETSYVSRRADQTDKDQIMQLVGFTLGREQFGVDILMVQEIIRSVMITAVPNSPDFIEGVINLRGSIIPVIDLRKRLRLKTRAEQQAPAAMWILIINVDDRVTGFIVDSVTKVLKINADTIEPPPDIVVAGLESQYIRGVCDIDNRLLILLDFSRILQLKEIRKLKELDPETERHG
jgi:purine-binding chemotaxis protein CheW